MINAFGTQTSVQPQFKETKGIWERRHSQAHEKGRQREIVKKQQKKMIIMGRSVYKKLKWF